jgi:hypothetical protein
MLLEEQMSADRTATVYLRMLWMPEVYCRVYSRPVLGPDPKSGEFSLHTRTVFLSGYFSLIPHSVRGMK